MINKIFTYNSIIFLLLASCAHHEQSDNFELPDQDIEETYAPQAVGPLVPNLSSLDVPNVEQEIDETSNQLEQDNQKHKIPVEINDGVKKWIHYFTHNGRERFQRYLDRGAFYRPMISQILKYENMPDNLYYLAMIESGFTVSARSHANAVGVWQFIRGTGTRYGLKVNSLQDDRRDPIRATQAAAKYLKDLHNVFNSWYLAMAAYNAGEGRIVGAIMRGKSRDFWELVEKRVLPKETMDYIPKFMAASILGEHPAKFGFTIKKDRSFPEVKLVKVPEKIPLHKIAESTNTNIRWLKFLNPNLIRGYSTQNPIWVPAGDAENIQSNFNEFLAHQNNQIQNYEKESVDEIIVHQVKVGESLSSISKRFRIPSSSIKKANRLKSSRLWVGQEIRIPTSPTNYKRLAKTENNKSVATKVSSQTIYHVGKGDNLSDIAEMTKTSLDQLKKMNNLKSGNLYSGQTLKLPLAHQIYKVRRGDNLTDIANRFKIPLKLISSVNRLNKRPIYPGQKLKITKIDT